MTAQQYANEFLFGLYPYICLAVFLVCRLVRFDCEQYGIDSRVGARDPASVRCPV